MTVTINEVPVTLPEGSTLADALATRTLPATGIAIAVNGTVVPPVLRPGKTLADGDKIIIIKAFYGG